MRFEEREFKPYSEPVSASELREGNVYFSLNFADDQMLIPVMEPLVFIGRNLKAQDSDLPSFGSTERAARKVLIGRYDLIDEESVMQGPRLRKGVLILLSGYMVGCVPVDTRVSNRFDSASSARVEGLFRRGWLPDVLPMKAGPIEEVHDLDTNARCSRSEFPIQSFREVYHSLRKKEFVEYKESISDLPFRSCPFSPADVADADTVMTRKTTSGVEFAAVDERGMLLFWSLGS